MPDENLGEVMMAGGAVEKADPHLDEVMAAGAAVENVETEEEAQPQMAEADHRLSKSLKRLFHKIE